MRRSPIVTSVLTTAMALATAACTTGSGSVRIPASPAPTPSGSPSPAVTLPPTGVAGVLVRGQATLTLSGGLNQTTTFPTLGAPAIWSPTPGTMSLSWTGADPVDSISIGGPSFSGQQSTSPTLTLAFSVKSAGGPKTFRSQAGECTVTLNPAAPTQVGGLVFCTNLKSVDGAVTVNAQGSFSAVG